MQGSNVSLVGFHVLGLSSAFPFLLVAFDASCEPCVGPACIRCCPFTCRKLSQGSRGYSLVLILRGAPPSRLGLRNWHGRPRLLLVYSTHESQQLGKHVSLAVEQVILCVKYAGVQNKVPQKG